jgi:hypothetical protein
MRSPGPERRPGIAQLPGRRNSTIIGQLADDGASLVGVYRVARERLK